MNAVIDRFIEFGQQLFGSEHGWKSRYAEALKISDKQLSNILSQRSPVGPAIRERLRFLGCDIDWLLTGKSAIPNVVREPISIWESRSGHITEQEKKELDKFIQELLAEADEANRKSAMDVARVILKKSKRKKDQ